MLKNNSFNSSLSSTSRTTVPLMRTLPADLETPVSLDLKLADEISPSFLLESVTGGEQVARFSLSESNCAVFTACKVITF